MKNLINSITENSIDMFKARLEQRNENDIFLTRDLLEEYSKIFYREMNVCLQGFGYSNWTSEERWHELFKISMDHYENECIYYDSPDFDDEFYY